ncbi:MAG: SRPBCC family protein [Sphingomonadaceae bacterium]
MSTSRTATLAGSLVTLGVLTAISMRATQKSKGSPKKRDDAPDYTHKKPDAGNTLIGRSVTIRKPREEVFRFWREFSHLPQFMENVESVHKEGGFTVWKIKGPAGCNVRLVCRVTDEREGELIAWSSVEGSDVRTEGCVTFTDAPGDRGTRVSLTVQYDPPAGEIGRFIAKLFLREPAIQARHDLKRLKMLLETGEIATSARLRSQTRAAQKENSR